MGWLVISGMVFAAVMIILIDGSKVDWRALMITELIGFTVGALFVILIETGGFDHPPMKKLYQERCLPDHCSEDE